MSILLFIRNILCAWTFILLLNSATFGCALEIISYVHWKMFLSIIICFQSFWEQDHMLTSHIKFIYIINLCCRSITKRGPKTLIPNFKNWGWEGLYRVIVSLLIIGKQWRFMINMDFMCEMSMWHWPKESRWLLNESYYSDRRTCSQVHNKISTECGMKLPSTQ